MFEANVSSQTDPAVQAQAALRVVLVRATGARDAANDPALAGVLAQAQTVRDCARARAARGSGTTLVFDAAALERDITRGGPHRVAAANARCCWSCSRAGPPRVRSKPVARSKARSMPPGNRRGQPISRRASRRR